MAAQDFVRNPWKVFAEAKTPEKFPSMEQMRLRAQAVVGFVVQTVRERAGSAKDTVSGIRSGAVDLAKDPAAQVTAASAAGGAAAVGTGGAAAGVAVGGVVGILAGVIPAVFTFGLSIPAGGMIGAVCGFAFGGATGTAVGAATCGVAGYKTYTKRDQIREIIVERRRVLVEAIGGCSSKVKSIVGSIAERAGVAHEDFAALASNTKGRACAVYTQVSVSVVETLADSTAKAAELAADRGVQVTAASAAGGAAVGSAGGAAAGFVSGGVVGAALGVVPALFTFGLSIPVFAALGSGCGAACGAAAGGAAGLAGGACAGHGAYSRRDAIGKAASNSVGFVRARLVGTTGGTSD